MSKGLDQSDSVRTDKKRVLRIFLIGGSIFALAFALIVIFSIDISYKHFGYAKAAQRYKNSGLPWTADDLVPDISAEGREGFEALVDYLDNYQTIDKEERPQNKNLVTPSDYAQLDKYFSSRNDQLNKANKIADRHIVWQKDWNDLALTSFGEMAAIKDLVKDLTLRAEVRSAKGDVDGAAADLKASVRMSEIASQGPTLINGLVSIACRAIVLRGLQRSTSFHLKNSQDLEKLRLSVGDLSTVPDLNYHLRGEAYLHISSLRNFSWQIFFNNDFDDSLIDAVEQQDSQEKLVRVGEVPGIAAKSFAVPILKVWADYADEVKVKGSSPQSMLKILSSLEKAVESERGVSASFMKLIMPVLLQAGQAYVRTEAEHLVADSALKAAVARAEGKTVSESLLANDPFGSGPLKMSVSGNKLKVWSIGLNRIDDNGLSLSEAQFNFRTSKVAGAQVPQIDHVDFVFELPYIAY